MKPEIHPKYFEAKVHCGSCGTEWTVGGTPAGRRGEGCRHRHPWMEGPHTHNQTAGPGVRVC